MEYLEGESLSERAHRGPMPAGDAIRYAIQIAEALDEAHQQGIVHRDLKPGNVVITRNGAKLLDFGIAKLRADATASLTGRGALVGTPLYMAPEQLEGKPADARTDIFALGLVICEMVIGRRPVEIDITRELPPALGKVVRRCLAVDPDERWQSCADLRDALDRAARQRPRRTWLVAVALALVALFGVVVSRGRAPRPSPKSIAVLPFENLSPDAQNAYFADGVTEDIHTQLAKIGDLRVIARTSVAAYKGKPLREIARDLGVTAVLEGSVRRAGDRVRIAGELIDASTERHLWADSYDRDLRDIFAVQSEVAERIAGALKAQLTAPEKERIEKNPTANIEAYELYLQGRELYNRYRKDDNEQAITLFERAVVLDPQFAPAWADLAFAYLQRGSRFGNSQSSIDRGEETARKALLIDPTLAEAHAALGASLYLQGHVREALEPTRKAAELKPSFGRAVINLAIVFYRLGRADEANRWMRRAVELEPRSGTRLSWLGVNWDMLGEPALAETALRRAIELQPEISESHSALVRFLLRQGRSREAREYTRKTMAAMPDEFFALYDAPLVEMVAGDPERARDGFERLLQRVGEYPGAYVRIFLARLYRRAGRAKEADAMLDQSLALHRRLIESGNETFEVRLQVAFIHAARGEIDEALRWLEQARNAGWLGYPDYGWNPLLDPLRQDPRFQALMKRIDGDVAAMRQRVRNRE
jgi:TolB-like protein/Tfp pilus assembly protein PilF